MACADESGHPHPEDSAWAAGMDAHVATPTMLLVPTRSGQAVHKPFEVACHAASPLFLAVKMSHTGRYGRPEQMDTWTVSIGVGADERIVQGKWTPGDKTINGIQCLNDYNSLLLCGE